MPPISVLIPEPEPELECIEVIQLDITSYILMFFGAGVGWFCLGYFTLKFAEFKRRQPAIIAQPIN